MPLVGKAMLLVCVASDADRRAVLDHVRGTHTACSVATTSSLARGLGAGGVTLLYDAGQGLFTSPALLREIEDRGVRMLVRVPISNNAIEELAAIVRYCPDATVGLAGGVDQGDRAGWVARVLAEPDGGPVARVIDDVAATLPVGAVKLLLPALVLGAGRFDVHSYAGALGCAPRTTQAMLQQARLPRPHRLLTWAQALWALWRMERWGMNAKSAAQRGGFPSTAAMSTALRPILGQTPHRAVQRGSLARTREAFVRAVTSPATSESDRRERVREIITMNSTALQP